MKVNLVTGDLFNDQGQLLKKMSCPKKESWDSLINEGRADSRTCAHCSQEVLDISKKSDTDVERIVQQDPDVCFCIDLKNTYIKVIR